MTVKSLSSAVALYLFAALIGEGVEGKFYPDLNRCQIVCPPYQVLNPVLCICVEMKPPVCPVIQCPPLSIPCDKYQVDHNGCPTCQCQCPRFMLNCQNQCQYGVDYVTDSNGCRVCRCKESPKLCPEVTCTNVCPYGTQNDANGCPTCQCVSRQCPRVSCMNRCPQGFIIDKTGCQTCSCQPVRPPVQCSLVCHNYCPYGNVMDSNGCSTCKCKPYSISLPFPVLCGPLPACKSFCPFGHVINAQGCPTCRCKSRSWRERNGLLHGLQDKKSKQVPGKSA